MKRTLLIAVAAGLLLGCSGSDKDTADTTPNSDVTISKSDVQNRPQEDQQDEPEKDVPAKPDIGVPPGYLEFCLGDGDCAEWGLSCVAESAADQEAFCSKLCATNDDCPDMLLCKPRGDQMACQPAAYCDLCDNDEQCGTNGRCIDDDDGGSFCSFPCAKDDLEDCGAGSFCNKVGAGLEDYFCYPMFGKCKGDGSHCTPCQSSDDCLKGHECHENPTTFERYCAKICQTKMDCPKGFGCHELAGEEFPLCTLEVNTEPKETCYQGNKDFCEPCMDDYECQSGVCYNYAVAGKYFCSFHCDYDTFPLEGCPTGLFCVPNHNPESGGEICAPSPAFGCQGFLNCVAVECPKGEKCVDGFCEPK